MEKEFNLSEKINLHSEKDKSDRNCIYFEDVKEFIRRLKKELSKKTFTWIEQQEIIDKLAGEKLK
jgi:hypothetical protein